jgi:hypothetical protein
VAPWGCREIIIRPLAGEPEEHLPGRKPGPVETEPGKHAKTNSSSIIVYGKLLLLLPLAVCLSRMLMCRLRLVLSIACMLLGIGVIALSMLLRCAPMRLGSLIMLVSRFLVHVLWHKIAP